MEHKEAVWRSPSWRSSRLRLSSSAARSRPHGWGRCEFVRSRSRRSGDGQHACGPRGGHVALPFNRLCAGRFAHGFEKGKKVEIQIKTSKEEATVTGTVEFVSIAIDAASGLQEVRAVFENKEGRIPAGIAGKMRLKPAP